MKEKTIQEFVSNAEDLVRGAALYDDFVKINTGDSNAILVSEAEWNIMVDALKMVLSLATK